MLSATVTLTEYPDRSCASVPLATIAVVENDCVPIPAVEAVRIGALTNYNGNGALELNFYSDLTCSGNGFEGFGGPQYDDGVCADLYAYGLDEYPVAVKLDRFDLS